MLHPPRKKEGFTCRFADFYSNCQGAPAVAVTAVNDRRSGDGRARTGDPLLAKQVLSQLSYAPKLLGAAVQVRRAWAFLDSNQRPHGYQPCALTN
jgi:hypothetical protein